MENLSKILKVTMVQAPLVSGGTDPASSYVDMSGFDSVMFLGNLGTAGSTDVATLAAWGATSTASTGTAITGATVTSTAGFDDDVIVLEISRPRERYIKTHLTNSAAIEWGGTNAIQGNPRVMPITPGSTTFTPDFTVGATTNT